MPEVNLPDILINDTFEHATVTLSCTATLDGKISIENISLIEAIRRHWMTALDLRMSGSSHGWTLSSGIDFSITQQSTLQLRFDFQCLDAKVVKKLETCENSFYCLL